MGSRLQALPLPLTGSGYQIDKNMAVAVAVADPECLEASVNQEVLINRRAVLYKVRRPERSTGAVPLVSAQSVESHRSY